MLLGLIFSFFESLKTLFTKGSLKDIHPKFLLGILSFFTSIVTFPLVLVEWIPAFSWLFTSVLLISSVLLYLWNLLYFRALRQTQVTHIEWLKWLITIGTIFTSYLLLWELPNTEWIAGILFIVLWVYLVFLQGHHTEILQPIRYIKNHTGVWLYILAVVCFSFTIALDKIGVKNSWPFFWTFIVNFCMFLYSLPYFIKNFSTEISKVLHHKLILFLESSIYVLAFLFQMILISVLLAGYVSAFKTASVVFSMILWGLFLWEKNIKNKFLWASLSVFGVMLIYFYWG